MELLIPVLYDMAAVIILLIAVSRSATRGFAATVVNIVGHIAAFFGALFLGKAGSGILYDMFVKAKVYTFLQDNIMDTMSTNEIVYNLQSAADTLPKILANLLGIQNMDILQQTLDSSVSDVISALESSLIRPAVTGFLHIILFSIVFAILCFMVRRVADATGLVFSLPLIRPVDRFLGGVLGLLQGGINLYLIALAVRFILYLWPTPPNFLSERMMMDTYIWHWIYTFNPFVFLQ